MEEQKKDIEKIAQSLKDKPVSESLRKSIEEKQKYVNKPIKK